jgi:hypothetical protein
VSGWQDAFKGKAISGVVVQQGFGRDAPTTERVEVVSGDRMAIALEVMEALKNEREACSVALETPNTSNLRQHWSVTARRTKSQREALKRKIKAWLNNHTPPKVLITVVRVSPRQLDATNLGSALKAAIDGIADGLRIDDGSPLVEWKLEQRKGPAAVEFKIEVMP